MQYWILNSPILESIVYARLSIFQLIHTPFWADLASLILRWKSFSFSSSLKLFGSILRLFLQARQFHIQTCLRWFIFNRNNKRNSWFNWYLYSILITFFIETVEICTVNKVSEFSLAHDIWYLVFLLCLVLIFGNDLTRVSSTFNTD